MLRQSTAVIFNVKKIPNAGLLSMASLSRMYSDRRRSSKVDRSRVPEVRDDDIEEHFVRGEGPGGQNVNKRSTCVVLRHVPTDTQVRCHLKRTQEENRVIARQMLRERLDQLLNGDMSVAAQLRRQDKEKQHKREQRAEKLREMKQAFRQRENLED